MTQVNVQQNSSSVSVTENSNTVSVSQSNNSVSVTQTAPGVVAVAVPTSLLPINHGDKVDGSLVVYNQSAGEFQANDTWTTSSIVDFGNF